MRTTPILIAAGTSLTLAFTTLAEPAGESIHPRPETRSREQSERAEQKIHHLEEAARHLDAAGMGDEADRLRDQATLRRTDLRKRLAELERLENREAGERRQREINALVEAAVTQLRKELRTAPESRQESQAAPATDHETARATEYRRQTLENWARIKEAARADRPMAPRDLVRPQDRRPDQSVPRRPAPGAPATNSHEAVLQQILQTLQRIEAKLAE